MMSLLHVKGSKFRCCSKKKSVSAKSLQKAKPRTDIKDWLEPEFSGVRDLVQIEGLIKFEKYVRY